MKLRHRTCALAVGAVLLLNAPFAAHAADTEASLTVAPSATTIPTPKPWPLRHLIEAGTLTVGITAKSPPKSFTSPSGDYDGTRVALFRKLASDLGLKITFVRLDWPGILPGLAAHRFDMACENVSWNPERISSPDYLLTRPVSVAGTVLLVRADSGIADWKGMTGRKLGGVRGEAEFASAEKQVPSAAPVALPGRPEGLMAVLNKQVDGFAADASTAATLIATSPRKAELKMVGPAINVQPAGLCVDKNEPDLAQAVDILLTNYRVDGTLARIETHYTGTDQPVRLLSTVGY